MRKPPITIFIAIFFVQAIIYKPVSAQHSKGLETISAAQGLSQGQVFDIIQDKDGFIWVANRKGLSRFDGYNFRIFTNDAYDKQTISSNTITTLFEDSRGHLWMGTGNGSINIYNKEKDRFYRVVHDSGNGKSRSGNPLKNRIVEMDDGRIIVAASDRGFYIISLPVDFFKIETAAVISPFSLPNNEQVYAIGKDANSNIWICGAVSSVYQFRPADNSLVPHRQSKFLSYAYVNTEGNIWTTSKFFLLDGQQLTPLFDLKTYPGGNLVLQSGKHPGKTFHEDAKDYDFYNWQAGKPRQLGEKFIPAASAKILFPFHQDRSGQLWAGTNGQGLQKYNTRLSFFNALAPGFNVRSIVPGSQSEIILGAHPYDWRRITGQSMEKDALAKILPGKAVSNMIIARNGNYWILTGDAELYQYNFSSHKLTSYPALLPDTGFLGEKQPMLEDDKGFIWIAKSSSELAKVNPENGSIVNFNIKIDPANPIQFGAVCTALYQDKQGVFWIGSEEGLARLELGNSQDALPVATWYRKSIKNRNSLSFNYVSCILDDPGEPTKYLWVCTRGGGLNRLNKTTGDFMQFSSKDGLPNDMIYGILADSAGNIWGTTSRGIFCMISKKENKKIVYSFRNFTKADGLQDDEFNAGAYAKLPNGNLAFGGVNGLNTFDPGEVLTTGFVPNVFITNILVNNQPITAGDKSGLLTNSIEQSKQITLSYLQNIITLEFSALDFTAPNQNKYRYQLAGIDDDWVESGTRRTATYLHLPSGKYEFKVQGSNSQGTWSSIIAGLQIHVLPPWWHTWWAYSVYAILIGLALLAYFKYNANRARLKSQLIFEQLEAKRAKELDTIKTQLYTNITHEFRTPLTLILGMAQQVIDKPARHLQNGMTMIIRNGQNLLNLVNEMLDLAKLETGKMELHPVKADVIVFVRYIIESFHSLAESQQKQLHFLSELDSMYVAFDQEKLQQIVSNLLSNALKFTEANGNIYITISANAGVPVGETTQLIIKVKDTGIGIPAAMAAHIFDRFYQLDNSHTRKTNGTGIGLALTKELVKLMEGDIFVKSPPTGACKGSEFTVVLPFCIVSSPEKGVLNSDGKNEVFKIASPPSAAVLESANEDAGLEQPLILLVEDNADVVAYTAACLPGYRLAIANDGREGFEKACQLVPNLVITDVMMPFVDGFELCRQLKTHQLTSHIPVIMLTAWAGIESKLKGLQLGADVYLEKPFNPEELSLRVEKLLEIRQSLHQYYLKKAGLASSSPTAEIITAAVFSDTPLENEFVKHVRAIIETNLADPGFSVEQLSKLAFMSHSQLHRKLEALTGNSPNKFIRIIRLNKARTLLKKPSNSIASIALDCGYNDPGYFARIFKKEYKVTPQEWRSNN